MTKEEAIELLEFHTYPNTTQSESRKGYLPMLRPFSGNLHEENFHELMQIIKVLSDDLREDKIDRKIISNFWSICQLSKAWAMEENGMLRSNKLITAEQINKISDWTDCISETIMNLLENLNDEIAFETYNFYLKDN